MFGTDKNIVTRYILGIDINLMKSMWPLRNIVSTKPKTIDFKVFIKSSYKKVKIKFSSKGLVWRLFFITNPLYSQYLLF